MTRAHDEPTRSANDIEQEAAEWLVKVDQERTPESARALAAWLGAHPRHRAAFLRISTAWRRADVMRRLADPTEPVDIDLLAPERPPANESLTEPSRVEPLPVAPSTLRPPRLSASEHQPRMFRRAIAAALALIVFGAAGILTYSAGTTQSYATEIGEFHRVTLEDGSSISLNTNTRVRVAYSRKQRLVELVQGEAQFEVAHDEHRPFFVSAGSTVVRDVGTVFSVRRRDSESVDVLVSEGRVAINPPSNNTVSAGQMALVRDKVVTTRTIDDITRRMAWTEGMLIFSGETLAEAVADFNRYNHRQLVIADPAIAGRTIGGAFKATSPDHFATALEKTFGVEARVYEGTLGSEIRLSGRGP